MATQASAVTADELLRMPSDGARYELLRGEVTRMAPAGRRHGRMAMNLATSLNGSGPGPSGCRVRRRDRLPAGQRARHGACPRRGLRSVVH
ncbi:MAG: Uma2 family endonuclease [Gammaproteobacteria bacterium]